MRRARILRRERVEEFSMTIKMILLSGVMTLGLAACHHDHATNTPANNTYTQPAPTSQAPGAINSTNNSSGNNSNNMNKTGARQEGTYNSSKNATPSATNGTNV